MTLEHREILFKNTDAERFTYFDYWLSDFLQWIFHSSVKIMKMTSAHVRSLSKRIFNLEFSLVVLILVLLSGDVSENPVPENSETSSQTSNSLSILHLNIRSIRNKLGYINENLIDFNVICFTKTHLDINVNNKDIFIEGSNSVPYRKDVTAHSWGFLVYVSNGLITSRNTELENYFEESFWIEIKHKGESILLGTIYRRPNTPVSFWDRLNISIEKASEISKNIIMVI